MNNDPLSQKEKITVPLSEMEDIITESIDHGGQFAMITAGNSMKPLLRNRTDTVILVKPDDKLKRYDIPLYKRASGQFVLHRIMKKCENCYMICGDNQLTYEKVPDDDRIIAVVSKVIRGGKEIELNRSFRYKVYVFLWCRCFFIRYICLHFKYFCGRISKFFRKR